MVRVPPLGTLQVTTQVRILPESQSGYVPASALDAARYPNWTDVLIEVEIDKAVRRNAAGRM
jgi:hypothetical protein